MLHPFNPEIVNLDFTPPSTTTTNEYNLVVAEAKWEQISKELDDCFEQESQVGVGKIIEFFKERTNPK